MLNILLAALISLSSLSCLASPLEHVLTVKERLRVSLWMEGISEKKTHQIPSERKKKLTEEIERALKKL